jgi:hypothetical protein
VLSVSADRLSPEAREQLTAALDVLRDDPDADTVRALGELAALEVHAGSPTADALSAEALALGQDLAVDDATLAGLFTTRGLCHGLAGRNPQAASYLQAAAQLAGQAGDTVRLGLALLNLADTVTGTDPAAGVEAARAAAARPRRAGARRQPAAALRQARAALDHAAALGISAESLRWAWPLAARAAHDLARARLAACDGDPATAAAFTAAVAGLREQSTPYHLAHGLLDHAEYLARTGDAGAAAAAVGEAREIAARLRCQPLLDRAGALAPQDSPNLTPQDSSRVAS